MSSLERTNHIQDDWTRDASKVDLVKRTIAREATDDELALFLATCQRTGLDPFIKQAFLVPRWDSKLKRHVMTFQTSVDGLRLVASRTGQYAGQTPIEWCGKDGKWSDAWLVDDLPAAARVGVYRQGFAAPLYAVAHYREYVQVKQDKTPNSMWASKPVLMLGKCAESLALRKAFPAELSGVYSTEESSLDDAVSLSTGFGQVSATETLGVDASPEDRVRAAFTALSPEQRQAFPEAVHAWCGLDVKGMKVSALIDALVDTLTPDDYTRLDVIVEAYWESIEPIDADLDPIEGQVEIDAS